MPRQADPAFEREVHWTEPDPIDKTDEGAQIIAALDAETDGDAIDLLGIAEEMDAELAPPEEPIPGLAQIFKALTAGDASKRINGLVAGMTRAVSALEGLGDKPMTPAIGNAFKTVAQSLALMSGEKAEAAKKAEGGKAGAAKKALESLMALANELKGQDASAEVPSGTLGKFKSVGSSIASLVAGDVEAGKKTDEDKKKEEEDKKKEQEARDKEAANKNDPVIVFKAGAKMRRARLSQFRKAVETLGMLLKELEGEPPDEKDKEKDKDKKKTTKAVEDAVAPLVKTNEALVEKVEALTTRLNELENVRGTGEGDDDPPPPVKKSGGLWGNVLGTKQTA